MEMMDGRKSIVPSTTLLMASMIPTDGSYDFLSVGCGP